MIRILSYHIFYSNEIYNLNFFKEEYFYFRENCIEKKIFKLLNSYNWLATFYIHNANYTAAVFNDALLQCLNRFVPLKVCKDPKFSQWVFKDLKHLIVNKKRADITFKRPSLTIDYNILSELRAKYIRFSKLDYSTYILSTEHSLSVSSRNFWKYIQCTWLKKTTPNPIFVQYPYSLSNNNLEYATFSLTTLGLFSASYNLLSPDFCKISNNLTSNCYITPDNIYWIYMNYFQWSWWRFSSLALR